MESHAQGNIRHSHTILFAIKYALPWSAYLFLIFYLSSISGGKTGGFQLLDISSFLHVVEYFFLAMFTYRFFFALRLKYANAGAFIFSLLYGISDEVHQLFVPFRVFSAMDIGMDFLGICLLLLLLRNQKAKNILTK